MLQQDEKKQLRRTKLFTFKLLTKRIQITRARHNIHKKLTPRMRR
jgi:hypothetical protein